MNMMESTCVAVGMLAGLGPAVAGVSLSGTAASTSRRPAR